ncbi:MAG: adhesin [Pseudomonas sp.]
MHLHHLIAICCLLSSVLAEAQNSTATIDASGAEYSGTLMLNQAAGELQQQVNARAIAPNGTPTITVEQQLDAIPDGHGAADFRAGIHGNAFSGGQGVLGVNQGAGVANQQINSFRLGVGSRPESLDDTGLAQSVARSSYQSAGEPREAGERRVDIDDQAFTDSRGVVQLNQAAGVGNRMVNNLGIRILE